MTPISAAEFETIVLLHVTQADVNAFNTANGTNLTLTQVLTIKKFKYLEIEADVSTRREIKRLAQSARDNEVSLAAFMQANPDLYTTAELTNVQENIANWGTLAP